MNTINKRHRILAVVMFLCCLGVARGQSLYDVVISLTDRQRVINQHDEVDVWLKNETNDAGDPDAAYPNDVPIDWHAVGTNPSESAVNGLGMGDRISLLNQAIAEFDRLKFRFLNSSNAEFTSGGVVGNLKTFSSADFSPLPRPTPQNYHEILIALSQRVRSLRLVQWPAAFQTVQVLDQTNLFEQVIYEDPDGDGNYEGRLAVFDMNYEEVDPGSFEWQPDSIGNGNLQVDEYTDTIVTDFMSAWINVFGAFSEAPSGDVDFPSPLRSQWLSFTARYPDAAKVNSTAPGAGGSQINGTVHVLRRSKWNQIAASSLPEEFDAGNGGYVVAGGAASGDISLMADCTGTVDGSWITTYSDGDGYSNQSFVEDGYQHKASSMLPSTDPGYSNDYQNAYESNWEIGCDFFVVFKPQWARGVDAPGFRQKLELVDRVLASNSADGGLLLRPRPELLFGIDLGPGLSGSGNGLVTGGTIREGSMVPYFGYGVDATNQMIRFDSTYLLKFAGCDSDYHVVYENDRNNRAQALPADGLGWPYVNFWSQELFDKWALYYAWDSPRLRQVAGRDLVADVVYDGAHYGGYTVRVYRRPVGSPAPVPGQVISVASLSLIREWTFSHPGGGTAAHPEDAEALEVLGNLGEEYEILANHNLPYEGIGLYQSEFYDEASWFQWMEGVWSWTLKLSSEGSEKIRNEIEVLAMEGQSGFFREITVADFMDGQEISSISSATLDPFRDLVPEDWVKLSAGKSISCVNTFDLENEILANRKWPVSSTIQFDGIQPDSISEWNAEGLLESWSQGPWSLDCTFQGNVIKQVHKLNGGEFGTEWIEFLDGGQSVKTYSAPKGGIGSKDDTAVAWGRVDLGDASQGLPGLAHKAMYSDGSGTTYDWDVAGDGAFTLTMEKGSLSGGSVNRGSRTVRSYNNRGYPVDSAEFVLGSAALQTHGSTFGNFTTWGAARSVTDFNTGLVSNWTFEEDLPRLSSVTSPLGLVSSFSNYDPLGRARTTQSNGITFENTFSAWSVTSSVSGGANGSISTNRDALGRLTSNNTTWNGLSDDIQLGYGNTMTTISRNHGLLGSHQTNLRRDDGSIVAENGQTLPFGGNVGESLSVENGLLKSRKALSGQAATFITVWNDSWGRTHKISMPSSSGVGNDDSISEFSHPNSTQGRVRLVDAAGRSSVKESDPFAAAGSIQRNGVDVDGDGTLGGSDRYVQSVTGVSNGKLVTVVSLNEDGGLREVLRTEWTPAGNQIESAINGNEEIVTREPNYGAMTVAVSSSKGWTKTDTINEQGLTTSSSLSGTGIPNVNLNPTWRADGSLEGVSLAIGGETQSASFKNDGTLQSLNIPSRGNVLGGHAISNGVETITVDGVTTVSRLDRTETTVSGTGVHGRTRSTTIGGGGFQHTVTPVVGSPTQTGFNAAGAPSSKSYAAGPGEQYAFNSGGLPASISLARGGLVQFGYSANGAKDLISISWPAVSSGTLGNIPGFNIGFDYDTAGRVREIGDPSGIRSFDYSNGRLEFTTWTNGPLTSLTLANHLDPTGRDIGFTLATGGSTLHSVQKAPNGESDQITALASGNVTVTPQRDLMGRVTGYSWQIPGKDPITQSWQRGLGGQITQAGSNVPGAPSFVYASFDGIGRRLGCTTDGAAWSYTYDAYGQLTHASHPTLGTFTYQFDGIGRRTNMGGGNGTDALNRTLTWTNDQNTNLNIQAHPDARVWVNGQEIPNFNGSSVVPVPVPGPLGGWVPWTTRAVLEGEGDPGAGADAVAVQSGVAWVPPVDESFTYDAAGNRQSSALWDFGWDAKNQLVRARSKGFDTALQGYDISFVYDSDGRRTRKIVSRYKNGSVVEEKTISYIWDGWDLVYEQHEAQPGEVLLERKYLWGPDIADGAAGGAGGLLLIREIKGGLSTDLIPLYDGTGHIVALTNGDKELLASYRYGPFGEKIHATGTRAQSNPWRFASKYLDEETGLYYFGRRYYDPVTGQWLSREPLGEDESLNLYSYCHNEPVNKVDVLGLKERVINDSAPVFFVDPENDDFVFMGFPLEEDGWFSSYEPNGEYGLVRFAMSKKAAEQYLEHPDLIARQRDAASGYLEADRLQRIARNGELTIFYVGNSLQVVGGYAEAAGGVALAPETGGVSLIAVAHGADVSATALRRLAAGPEVDIQSATSTGLQMIGLSRGTAEKVDLGASLIGAGGAMYSAGRVPVALGSQTTMISRGNLWSSRPPGVQVRQIGGYWVKRVDPAANPLMRWWGRQSINAQYRGLQSLREMATPNTMRNGMLFTRDVGKTLPDGYRLLNRDSLRAYLKGSWRMRTPWNDIQPRNMGTNGLIFDPAIDPVTKGIAVGVGAGVGYGVYEMADDM